jgi:hypothetical protein
MRRMDTLREHWDRHLSLERSWMVVDRYDNDPTIVDSMSDRRPETVARHPVYSAI